MIKAKVLADSCSTINAFRLITLELTFPRFILAEFNTHRVFSRNSASSRAVPTSRQFELLREHPFVPKAFSINKAGMSADEYVYPGDIRYAIMAERWLQARDDALKHAEWFAEHGVHKQHANRIIEPFMYHTVIVSSTDYSNFFDLRISPHAQPEINELAIEMKKVIDTSTPSILEVGDWHLPLIDANEEFESTFATIVSSVARIAAVSYNRQDVKNKDKEIIRFSNLAANKHLSPFEHAATPSNAPNTWANFKGWQQARWFIERGLPIR